MSGRNKLLLALMVLGLVVAGIGYVSGASTMVYVDENWRISVPRKTDPQVYEAPAGQVKGVAVDVGMADVTVQGYDGDVATVEIVCNWGTPADYSFEDGVIRVSDQAHRPWLGMGLFVSQPNRVSVKLPRGQYGVDVSGGTGALRLNDLTPTALNVKNGTGDLVMNNVSCPNARLETGTGSISVEKWAGDGLYAKSGTGRIQIRGDFAGETRVENGTGSISLATVKPESQYRIEASTGTGGVTAPQGDPGAPNLIWAHTGTGGIKVICGAQDAMG